MINVNMELVNDDCYSLSIKGHANQNDVGKDIICASASILAYTLAQSVKDMYDEGKLVKKPNIKLNKGNSKIVVKPKEEYKDEVVHTFFVIHNGYRLLAHNYPEYLTYKTMFGKA